MLIYLINISALKEQNVCRKSISINTILNLQYWGNRAAELKGIK